MAPPTFSTTAFLTLAAALVLLFAVADARLSYDFPDFRVKEEIPTTTADDQDADPILLLPSDNPAAVKEVDEASEPAKEEEEKKKTAKEEEEEENGVPMTLVRFRPINRNFAIRPINRHFRGGAHRCRHGGQTVVRGLRPWTPRYGRIRDLPFRNDAVLTGDSSADLPLRWRQPDYKHKRAEGAVIDLSNDVVVPADEVIKKPHHGHHRHGDGGEHQHENLILHKIRKFLNNF